MNDVVTPARHGATFGQVMSVFSFVLLVASVGGVYLYFKHVAYARVAARHLPADTRLAVRCDVETMLVLGPLRDHLLPLFELGVPRSAGLRPRSDRFRARTGVELARDLREVVVGIGPNEQSWVVVFGGKFPRSGMVDGLDAVLHEELAGARRAGAMLVLERGPAIGQAVDGALIVASDVARLNAALAGSEAFLTLGLPPEGAGGFAAALSDVRLPGLVDLERVSGAFELGAEVDIDAALRFAGEQPRAAEAVAAGVHELGRRAPAGSGVGRALTSATVQSRRPNELGLRARLSQEELDLAALWLAGAVETHLEQSLRGSAE